MTGIVARLLSKYPELTPFQVKTVLSSIALNADTSNASKYIWLRDSQIENIVLMDCTVTCTLIFAPNIVSVAVKRGMEHVKPGGNTSR